MSDQYVLWNRIHAALVVHQKPCVDHTPQMALDRVAAKYIGCIGLSFNKSNCTVHEEILLLDDLRKLRRHHGKTRLDPQLENCPLVVLQYKGQRIVIDGNTRVNKWVATDDAKPRYALIITHRAEGPMKSKICRRFP